MSLIWFLIFVSTSGLAVLGLFYVRHDHQRLLDADRRTLELVFPAGLEHAAASRLLTAFSGLFPPIGKTSLDGRPSLVLEIFSTQDQITYLLSFPTDQLATVRNRLLHALPDLHTFEYRLTPRRWRRTAQFRRPAEGMLDKADPAHVATLLGGLVVSAPEQAVMLQLILTPTGRPADDAQEPGYFVSLRLAVAAATGDEANQLLHLARSALGSLHFFQGSWWGGRGASRLINGRVLRLARTAASRLHYVLVPWWQSHGLSRAVNERHTPRWEWRGLMTPSQIAAVFLPIGSPQVRGLELAGSKQLAPHPSIGSEGRAIITSSAAGGHGRVLALTEEDRKRHLYVVGPSGRGKTTLLENLIVDDINEGYGLGYIDPKGDSVLRVLDRIPAHRLGDVVLFDPADHRFTTGFNVLAGSNPYAVADQIVGIFDALYHLGSAPRAVNLLGTVLTTLAMSGHTLAEVPLILDAGAAGEAFRAKVVPRTAGNRLLHAAWRTFEGAKDKEDQAAPILHRLGALLLDPRVYAALSQPRPGLDMADVLAGNKILLVPLNEHDLGDRLRPLLGSLVTAKFWQAAQNRRGGRHKPFFWYVDEFDDMASGSYGAMVARARGHDVGLVLAHQQPDKLSAGLRAEIFSNISSKVVFQTTNDAHARILAKEFGEPVNEGDIKNLGAWEVLARLTAGGVASPAASGRTAPPTSPIGLAHSAIQHSRLQYGRLLADVLAEQTKEVHGTALAAAVAKLPMLD